MQKVLSNVADAPARKKYVAPEIQVIPLDVEGPLLNASAKFGTMSGSDGDWVEEE